MRPAGSKLEITLEPKEVLYFFINDATDGYGDNRGTVEVDWETR